MGCFILLNYKFLRYMRYKTCQVVIQERWRNFVLRLRVPLSMEGLKAFRDKGTTDIKSSWRLAIPCARPSLYLPGVVSV